MLCLPDAGTALPRVVHQKTPFCKNMILRTFLTKWLQIGNTTHYTDFREECKLFADILEKRTTFSDRILFFWIYSMTKMVDFPFEIYAEFIYLEGCFYSFGCTTAFLWQAAVDMLKTSIRVVLCRLNIARDFVTICRRFLWYTA